MMELRPAAGDSAVNMKLFLTVALSIIAFSLIESGSRSGASAGSPVECHFPCWESI